MRNLVAFEVRDFDRQLDKQKKGLCKGNGGLLAISLSKGTHGPRKLIRGPCNENQAPSCLHEALLLAPAPVVVSVVGVRRDPLKMRVNLGW